jgi:LemA protein
LLVVVERYPELKANQNFLELQSQLEGTENRIAVARNRYIASVKDFNVTVREFPTNLTAGMFGFDVKPNFSVQNEAAISTAPAVTFDTSTPAQSATPVEGAPSPATPPPAN